VLVMFKNHFGLGLIASGSELYLILSASFEDRESGVAGDGCGVAGVRDRVGLPRRQRGQISDHVQPRFCNRPSTEGVESGP